MRNLIMASTFKPFWAARSTVSSLPRTVYVRRNFTQMSHSDPAYFSVVGTDGTASWLVPVRPYPTIRILNLAAPVPCNPGRVTGD